MTRVPALFVAILLTLPLAAGETPAPEIAGGLRRAPMLGAALNVVEGRVIIEATGPGSPAAKLGLQHGDAVVTIDGQAIADPAAFVGAIAKKRSGDSVTIVVRRGEETLTKQGTLGAVPLEQQADYDVEYGNVEVPVDRGMAKRRVIVTKPRGAEKHPAVLLIGGIGCYSLDGILRPAELRDPYGKILDALTRAGYATMRVEKSGMGDSEGPPCADPRSDFEAEARGFAAGLARLESLDFVDQRNVFLFAHSIGPLVAARIASEHPVRGIAAAETIGTSWLEYELTNVRRQLVLNGMPYDEVERRTRRHELCAHRFYVDNQMGAGCAAELRAPAPATYMQQLGALDLAALWKKIDAPVLLFYGTADFVTDDYQHRYLRDMINSFYPGRATYVKIDDMEHSLMIADSFAQRVADETLRFFNAALVKG